MRTAVVTGASSGIGQELARALAARGYGVALLARRAEKLEELAGEIRSRSGVSVSVHPVDVTDARGVFDAVRKIEAEMGPIDLAIANAGIGFPTPAKRFELEKARMILRTNVEGMLNLFAAVIPAMVERGSGRFAGVASVAGFRGLPGASSYSASKAAMQAFLEASRIELAGTGVGISIVNPGFVETPLTEKNRFPMPFLMKPDRAARLIVAGLERGAREINFPFVTVLGMRLARLVPNAIYDRISLRFARRKMDSGKYRT
ncbi:MAG TPA: SDR family NAD(P)-dependent oxidoreductase [Thermoanaerobaculia bacterium]|nr:SDR family NAD(P)-dependent oxidoreductase [Thermoanaerobaculia bacterium]